MDSRQRGINHCVRARVSNWQVGSKFYPITGEERRGSATRINLMRSGYDCWGTAERHTLICAYGKHIRLVERECPEWSGREGGQGWMERDNRSEKHWFLTRCESTWEETRCRDPARAKREGKMEGRMRKVGGWFSFHPYIHKSIHPSIHPPTSQGILSAGQGVIREGTSSNTSPEGSQCFKQDGWYSVFSEKQEAKPEFVTSSARPVVPWNRLNTAQLHILCNHDTTHLIWAAPGWKRSFT